MAASEKRWEDFPIEKRTQNTRRWTKEMRAAYGRAMLEHAKDRLYEDLVNKAAFVRGASNGEEWQEFYRACMAGEIVLDSRSVQNELHEAVKKMRMHASCREHFLETGHASYCRHPGDTFIDKKHCDVCGHTLGCDHAFEEISGTECDRLGVKHFGSCYHADRCKKCGEVSSRDSSD